MGSSCGLQYHKQCDYTPKKFPGPLKKTISSGSIAKRYDYSRTLLEWKKNFNNSWPKLKLLNFDEKFNRLWNYYLDYCETGFSLDHTDVTQFFIKKIS